MKSISTQGQNQAAVLAVWNQGSAKSLVGQGLYNMCRLLVLHYSHYSK